MSGNVVFRWTPSSNSSNYYVFITRDRITDARTHVYDTQYTVKDAILYDSITINVRTPESLADNVVTYNVSKVKSQIGGRKNISWTAAYFPYTGYYIYHTNKNRTASIMQVYHEGATLSPKYSYLTRPFNSTNIMFEIRNITLDDAGYYNGGIISDDAGFGGGVILIVSGTPKKPRINGTLTTLVDTYLELTCISRPTSTPDYYSKHVTLSYSWFINNTKMDKETRDTMRLKVTKGHRYTKYSCTATEEDLESDQNGPEQLIFTPKPNLNKYDKFTVKEGDVVGPIFCSADCNPPCNVTWKYKESNGLKDALSQNGILLLQSINRNVTQIICLSRWKTESVKKDFTLDVQYIDDPIIYVNDEWVSDRITVDIQERKPLQLSCFVNGNPTLTVRLGKTQNGGTVILSEARDHWSNYSFGTGAQCSDTGTYVCSGQSTDLKTNTRAIDLVWLGPDDLPTNITTSAVLQLNGVIYKHRIISIISGLEDETFGEYKLLYEGKVLTNVFIRREVSKVKAQIGGSAIIRWTASSFPSTGQYLIYHRYKENRTILSINSSGVNYGEDTQTTKYAYTSRPFSSTNIVFEIRDITLDDAGYYNGGVSADAAWAGGGVVLIVSGEPRLDKEAQLKTLTDLGKARVLIIPVIAYPPPDLSKLVWLAPNNLPSTITANAVIQSNDIIYKHRVITIVSGLEDEHYGEYKLLYNRKFLTSVIIRKEEDAEDGPLRANIVDVAVPSTLLGITWILLIIYVASKVSKVKTQIGGKTNISWTAAYFPFSGQYYVYHTYKENRTILSISSSGVNYGEDTQTSKYAYTSRPFNSTNIVFEIRDITLDDAGYYNGGLSADAAWSGGGVVLIVSGKPEKPKIDGKLNTLVNAFLELICVSKSTSTPDYYSKLLILSYTWFINNTKVEGKAKESFILNVTKWHRYNRYSCLATEEDLESDRSDAVQINPLYGPEKLTLTPKPKLDENDKFTVLEGDIVGPILCSADCNPPCNVTWKYKDSNGQRDALSQKGILLLRNVNRNIDDPIIYVNDEWVSDRITVDILEGKPFHMSCFVEGNPTRQFVLDSLQI
uniref:Ig-like domain-containing protein n=1 Tax=Magallana gigas TaxID=29159 RepID=K1QI22_MAGGI